MHITDLFSIQRISQIVQNQALIATLSEQNSQRERERAPTLYITDLTRFVIDVFLVANEEDEVEMPRARRRQGRCMPSP